MTDYSRLLLYVPGILIFLVGSGQVRRFLTLRRAEKQGSAHYGSVVICNHVVKKDKQDREVFNYYNTVVEFVNGQNHKERQSIKTPSAYAIGQQLRIFKEPGSLNYSLIEDQNQQLFNPWELMIGGALCILLALETNQGNDIGAMICLAALLLGAGASLVADNLGLKKRNLQEMDGEIIEVYSRQISRATKILKGDKFTYYPIVRYELNGKENIRKCNINSSNAKSFKVGERMKLYYDPEKRAVFERQANRFVMAVGILLIVTGALAGLSTLSVL